MNPNPNTQEEYDALAKASYENMYLCGMTYLQEHITAFEELVEMVRAEKKDFERLLRLKQEAVDEWRLRSKIGKILIEAHVEYIIDDLKRIREQEASSSSSGEEEEEEECENESKDEETTGDIVSFEE